MICKIELAFAGGRLHLSAVAERHEKLQACKLMAVAIEDIRRNPKLLCDAFDVTEAELAAALGSTAPEAETTVELPAVGGVQ